MDRPSAAGPPAPEQFRDYLLLLARLQLGADRAVEPSDIVQQTLLDAVRQRERFRGEGEKEMAGWLRQMLACNIADAFRARHRVRRDVRRERSLQQELEASSVRLEAVLAWDGPSPSRQAIGREQAVRLADALMRLPEAQREAILSRYYHGQSLAEISRQMGRTTTAVAGLLKRGAAQLRTILDEGE